MKTYIVVPDIHVPFHDSLFLAAISDAIKILRPTGMVQLGDFCDCPQVSSYDKDPGRKDDLWDDMQLYGMILDEWESLLPRGAEFHQLEGNHEDRLRRYISRAAPALHGLVRTFPEVLRFDERTARGNVRYTWHPLKKWNSCVLGDTVLHHGHYFDKHVAVNNLGRYPTKLVTGHTHRVGYASCGSHWSASLGHGSVTEMTMHQPTPSVWQQAFGILTLDDWGRGSLEIVEVQDGVCILRGKLLGAA